jgi:hypothetical protein
MIAPRVTHRGVRDRTRTRFHAAGIGGLDHADIDLSPQQNRHDVRSPVGVGSVRVSAVQFADQLG